MLLIGSLVGAALLGAVPATAATQPPAKWDPRVTKYVRFVERHRKLKFEHPVPVKFLGDAAFVKAYQGDDPKITKRDRADADRIAGQLRAFGLIEGPVDLIQSSRDLGASDTIGFYDQEKQALYVRGHRCRRRRRARHPGPRAHPRTPGPALRPDRARRPGRDVGRGLRAHRAGRGRRHRHRGRLPVLAATTRSRTRTSPRSPTTPSTPTRWPPTSRPCSTCSWAAPTSTARATSGSCATPAGWSG